jgi:hypothetical protein
MEGLILLLFLLAAVAGGPVLVGALQAEGKPRAAWIVLIAYLAFSVWLLHSFWDMAQTYPDGIGRVIGQLLLMLTLAIEILSLGWLVCRLSRSRVKSRSR